MLNDVDNYHYSCNSVTRSHKAHLFGYYPKVDKGLIKSCMLIASSAGGILILNNEEWREKFLNPLKIWLVLYH